MKPPETGDEWIWSLGALDDSEGGDGASRLTLAPLPLPLAFPFPFPFPFPFAFEAPPGSGSSSLIFFVDAGSWDVEDLLLDEDGALPAEEEGGAKVELEG